MRATAESEFPQAPMSVEDRYIERVNRELDLCNYPLAQALQTKFYPREACLIGDIPRVFYLVDGEIGCEGRFASTTLRWCNKKTGEHGVGVITLLARIWNVTEFIAACFDSDFIRRSEISAPHDWPVRRHRAKPNAIRAASKGRASKVARKTRCAFCGA